MKKICLFLTFVLFSTRSDAMGESHTSLLPGNQKPSLKKKKTVSFQLETPLSVDNKQSDPFAEHTRSAQQKATSESLCIKRCTIRQGVFTCLCAALTAIGIGGLIFAFSHYNDTPPLPSCAAPNADMSNNCYQLIVSNCASCAQQTSNINCAPNRSMNASAIANNAQTALESVCTTKATYCVVPAASCANNGFNCEANFNDWKHALEIWCPTSKPRNKAKQLSTGTANRKNMNLRDKALKHRNARKPR